MPGSQQGEHDRAQRGDAFCPRHGGRRPDSPAAFRDNNHAITDVLPQQLLELLQLGREDLNHGECEVNTTPAPRSTAE